MVGRNCVDSAVAQPGDDGKPVFLGAERRAHAVIRVAGRQFLLRQREVVGCRFRRDAHTAPLCVADHGDGVFGADVADVHRRAVSRRKGNFPRGAAVLGGRGNSLYAERRRDGSFVQQAARRKRLFLTVGANRQAEARRFLHGAGQHRRVCHRAAVVAQRDGPRLPQSAPVARFPAAQPFRNSRGRVHARVRPLRLFPNISDRLRRIGGRRSVRHTEKARHAARRRRAAPGKDVFLFGGAGVPQVDVHIDKPRSRGEAFGADFPRAFRVRKVPPNAKNRSAARQDIFHGVAAGGRVDDARRPDENLFHVVSFPGPGIQPGSSRYFVRASTSRAQQEERMYHGVSAGTAYGSRPSPRATEQARNSW